MQADEDLCDCTREVFIHGEVLTVPVNRRAKSLHLRLNGATIMLFPFPDAFEECFPAQLLPAVAFGSKLALHHHLRGNAGMVRSRQPERIEATHATPAHD